MNKRILYYGGILGPIVFLLNDIIGSIITQGYNPIINAVSELTQAGSEYICLLGSLFFISAIMLSVFGIGVVTHYMCRNSELLLLGGIFIIFLGLFSALSGTIFPMDPFNAETTFAGRMHIILTGLNIILIVLAIPMIGIGFYRTHQWKSFRLYSIISVLIMLVFGASTAVLMTNDIKLLGLFERITIYSYQLWIFVLANKLITDKGFEKRIEEKQVKSKS